MFPNMRFTEWELPESHDIIFGQPWFMQFNPQIHWRSQLIEVAASTQLTEVDGPIFLEHRKQGAYANIIQVKATHVEHQKTPKELQSILNEFSHVFLDQIPDEMREVNFK